MGGAGGLRERRQEDMVRGGAGAGSLDPEAERVRVCRGGPL